MRRDTTVRTLCCPVSLRERMTCDEIKSKTALTSDAQLVQSALYYFAIFVLGKSEVDTALFQLHTEPARRRRRIREAS